MNRSITLTAFVLLFFSTAFNPALIPASFNKTPDTHSKAVLANSSTIWVPDNYTTIQAAINAANPGDTIHVKAGTYYGHVVADKALSLVGESPSTTVIDGGDTERVVTVIASNVNISNFTIQNAEWGIWLWGSSNVILTNNTAFNNRYGIYLLHSDDNVLADNNVSSNNQYGIFLSRSSNNLLTNNTAFNNRYGIYLGYSSNNLLTNNTAFNNRYGIYLLHSGNNVLADNSVSSNNEVGIYLDSCSYNALTGNDLSSNNEYEILLYHSSNIVLTGNNATNSSHGIYVGDSDTNILLGNGVSNNQYGIYLYYSRDNLLVGNTATDNQYGIYLSSSVNDVIFNNNFINNTEPTSSINSANTWDNGVEGNYWSDYDGTDANRDGIGDTPYSVDENIQDNYPLMATFLQFKIATEKKYYEIGVVCNSTISNFQYRYDPDNKINTLSFKVNYTEGKGFCRIGIPHALIEPPYTVTVNHNPPSYSKTVYTNGTHTWLYFTYDHTEHEVIIMHMPYPEQLLISRWAIFGLTVGIVILLSISINYYRKFNKQKKIIQEYERVLGSFPVSHSERARALFIRDVIERKEKIETFKKKYGIKIQPATTLEDLIEKLGGKKEKS